MNLQLLLLGAVWFFGFGSSAQNSPYQSSTEFWGAYNNIASINSPNRFFTKTVLQFIGNNEACVKLYDLANDSDTSFFLPKNGIIKFELDNYSDQYNIIEKQSFSIVASAPITIFQFTNLVDSFTTSFNRLSFFEASFLTPNLYKQQSFFSLKNYFPYLIRPVNQLFSTYRGTILSAEDGNEIELTTHLNFIDLNNFLPNFINIPDTIVALTLNAGETYSFFVTNYLLDTTLNINRSEVISLNDKIFKLSIWPRDIYQYNYSGLPIYNQLVYEDLKPLTSKGTSFHIPTHKYLEGYICSIFSLEDNTEVSINGGPLILLNENDRLDTVLFADAWHIEASEGILASMGSLQDTINLNLGSPFSVTLSHDAELIKESLFATMDMPQPDTDNQYILSVVTKTPHTSLFTLNGAPVGAAAFSQFPADPNWSYANIVIPKGIHKVASDSGFHAFHYTYHPAIPNAPADSVYPSYGFVLGESNVWPADSFVNEVGTDLFNFQPFSSAPLSVCEGETLFFRPSHLRHMGYEWDFGDGTLLPQDVNNERAPAITHIFSQPGTYWVVLRDTAGCSALDSTLIVVTAQPETTFEYAVSASCSGREVELTYTGNAGAVSWNWVSGSGSGQNVRFQTRTESDSLQITLVATENNCSATRTATIPLVATVDQIVFPNVITPNGDGINDSWCFEGAASFSDCFEIQIFSRWGQKVFQSTSPETCWDPRDLPTGVYFFTTTVGVETRNGTITVIK